MVTFFIRQKMIDGELSFNRDQCSLPQHERCFPRLDKRAIFVEDRLLLQAGSTERESWVEIRHHVRFIGGVQ